MKADNPLDSKNAKKLIEKYKDYVSNLEEHEIRLCLRQNAFTYVRACEVCSKKDWGK